MGTSHSRNSLTVNETYTQPAEPYCSQCLQNQRGIYADLPMSKGAHAIQAMKQIEKPKPKTQEPFHGFCYKSGNTSGPKTVINL